MRELQNEVVQIVQSDDLMKFKEVGNRFDIQNLNEQSLKTMAEVIMNWN